MLTQVNAATRAPVEPWFDPRRRGALLRLLAALDDAGYTFVTPTPGTHTRVLKRRPDAIAASLRDVIGWSLPFARDVLEPALLAALEDAGAVHPRHDGLFTPLLRVSRVERRLFLHSAYPTTSHDSIFLGPDSARFAQLIAARLVPEAERILDYGAGAGVGGVTAAALSRNALLTLADVNPKALFLAGINAEHAGLHHEEVEVAEPQAIGRAFDLIVTHPPFMIDTERRAYRDGGGLYGAQLSLDWTLQAIRLLAPGGRLILHTGVSIVDGRDVLLDALRERLPAIGYAMDYHELDPDIFSEDLDQPGYEEVERIAAVGLVVRRTDPA